MKRSPKDQAAETIKTACSAMPSTAVKGPISHAIFRLAKVHRLTAGTLLRELGLYPGQELLLMELWDRDGINQSVLNKSIGLDASTITKMVQRLEAEGFLTRKSCSDDKRAMNVYLTKKGKDLKVGMSKLWCELEKRTTKDLSQAEQADLLVALQNIEGNLAASLNCKEEDKNND